jgi:hypothetical protein
MEPSYGEIYAMEKSYLAVKMANPEELYDMVHTDFVLVDAKKKS